MNAVLRDLEDLLARHPDAWVAAMGSDLLYTSMPEGLPVAGHPVMQGRWILDHVAPADRPALSEAWRHRAANLEVAVRVELTHGARATLHAFDLARSHGVTLVVAVPEDGEDLAEAMGRTAALLAPRFCRMLRDTAGRILEADPAAALVLGCPGEDLTKREAPLNHIHPDDHRVVIDNWMATLGDPSTGHRCRVRYLRGDGSSMWVEVTNFNRLDDPVRPGVVSEILDISEEMAAHDEVRAREQLLHRLAEALPVGVLQLGRDRKVVYRNEHLTALVGGGRATDASGLFATAVPGDMALLEAAIDAALGGEDIEVTVRVLAPPLGTERILRVVLRALTADLGGVTGAIGCVTDVTEMARQERELERRATVDPLTGCFNRASILDRLENALRSEPGEEGTAVIFLDLDGFKEVNDGSGHAVGDEVLRRVGELLQATVRDEDSVGRLGGDEFLVICRGMRSALEAMDVAVRLTSRLHAAPSLPVRTSAGVAWTAQRGRSADELVSLADRAMYASKREGLGRPHLAEPLPALPASCR